MAKLIIFKFGIFRETNKINRNIKYGRTYEQVAALNLSRGERR